MQSAEKNPLKEREAETVETMEEALDAAEVETEAADENDAKVEAAEETEKAQAAEALAAALQKQDVRAMGYERALHYLSFRPRSAQEVAQYLKGKGLDEEDAAAVLERLQQARLVDDAAFAQFWVNSRENARPKGAWALRAELRQKGIADKHIAEGESAEGGLFHYHPDRSLTRAEFCTILTRYLGLDTDLYAQTALPFEDGGQIADWALPYIRAIYARGLINGRDLGGGHVAFDPAAPITRAEMMTILGKTLPKGYPQPALAFTDGEQVPAWAAPYVSLLTGIGIVGGYPDGSIGASGLVLRSEAAKVLACTY